VIYAQTDSNKIIKQSNGKEGVLPIIMKIIRNLYKNGVTNTEVEMAKQNIRGTFLLDLEDSENMTYSNGVEYLMKIPPKEIVQTKDQYHRHYEHITKKHVDSIIQKYLNPSAMVVCMVGEHVPSQESVKKICER
jgi:predicted Zn-dependent peptidase